MKRINRYDLLQEERQLTRQRIAQLEILIEEDIQDIKNSLDPIKAAGNVVKNMISSEKDGVMSESIGLTVDTLIKKLLLRRSNWIFKLVTAFLIKNYARNIFSKNSGNILKWLIAKLRKSDNGHSREYFHDPTSSGEWET